MEPRGRSKVRGFVGLEDHGRLFRFPRDTLSAREALGHAGEKLAGKVLSGCERFSHRPSASPVAGDKQAGDSNVPLASVRQDHRSKDLTLPAMNARAGDLWNGLPIPVTPPSLEELAEMLKEPPACWIAYAALGRRDDEASLAILVAETASPDQFRRRSAVEAIGNHARGGAASLVVRRLLSDESPFVVRSAVSAVQQLADAGSHDAIVGLLNDAEPTTRTTALHALTLLWRPEDVERVILVARKDPAKQVRREAGMTLRDHADEANWRRLVELWISSEMPRERVWACELVKQFGMVADIPVVVACSLDQDGHVRKAAQDASSALSSQPG